MAHLILGSQISVFLFRASPFCLDLIRIDDVTYWAFK